MKDKTLKWLGDILNSAEIILSATNGKNIDDYRRGVLLRAAVERHFEIIGEAVNRIARHDPDTVGKIGNYSRIISFRNLLAHGYDLIDDEDVWAVVWNDLPVLLKQVKTLLENE